LGTAVGFETTVFGLLAQGLPVRSEKEPIRSMMTWARLTLQRIVTLPASSSGAMRRLATICPAWSQPVTCRIP